MGRTAQAAYLFRVTPTKDKLRRKNARCFQSCSTEREFALTFRCFEPTHIGCYRD